MRAATSTRLPLRRRPRRIVAPDPRAPGARSSTFDVGEPLPLPQMRLAAGCHARRWSPAKLTQFICGLRCAPPGPRNGSTADRAAPVPPRPRRPAAGRAGKDRCRVGPHAAGRVVKSLAVAPQQQPTHHRREPLNAGVVAVGTRDHGVGISADPPSSRSIAGQSSTNQSSA